MNRNGFRPVGEWRCYKAIDIDRQRPLSTSTVQDEQQTRICSDFCARVQSNTVVNMLKRSESRGTALLWSDIPTSVGIKGCGRIGPYAQCTLWLFQSEAIINTSLCGPR